MSTDLSPQNETFLDEQVARGEFSSRGEALDAAIELLRQRTDAVQRIDVGRRQLDAGDFVEYDDESLKARFDELKARAAAADGEQK